jgi:hypothetical protein
LRRCENVRAEPTPSIAIASPPAAPIAASPQSKPGAGTVTRTIGVVGVVIGVWWGPIGLAYAAPGMVALRASARAVAFLMRAVGSIGCCLLVVAGRRVRPDRSEPCSLPVRGRLGAVGDRQRGRAESPGCVGKGVALAVGVKG